MKTIQSKSLLTLIIIFFIIGFSTSAKNFIGDDGNFLEDSIPLAVVNEDFYVIDNPNRVVYPSILKEHREESKAYIGRYSKREREYIIHMFKRGKNYFPRAEKILDKYGVAYEFQMLPALESNFTANAVSSAGAVGYWQFMSELAQEYGLKIGGKYDERKNFTKATTAAARYFRDYMKYFDGDILMTVASYNCGAGRVMSSIKKSGKKNPDYWDIKKYLPAETRKFVMNFISLNVIAANYDNFIDRNLDFEAPKTIRLAKDISIDVVTGSGNTL